LTNQQKTISTFRRLLYILVGFGVVTILFYFFVYFQSRLWQALIPPALILVGVGGAPIVTVYLRRGLVNLAGTIMIVAVAVAYGGSELAWRGLTVYHIAGGILLILLSGSFILPRQWRIWSSAAVIYLVAILLVNRFEPIPRIDQNLSPMLLPYAVGTNLLLTLALTFQLLLELPIHSIRVRLIGTFLLLVIVPVTLTGTVAMVLNAQNSQDAVKRQLESVASLKESAARSWMNNLQLDLETIASDLFDINQAEILLSQSNILEDAVYRDTYNQWKQNITNHMENTGFYSEILLVDLGGAVVFSTDAASQGKRVDKESFFSEGLKGSVLLPPITKEGQGNILFVARPIKTPDGQTIAVLAGRTDLNQLNNIMVERVGLGNTGETYLVNRSHHLITDSLFDGYKTGESFIFSYGIDQALYENKDGSGSYSGYRVRPVLGVYRWIPELGVALIAEQERSEALRSTFQGIYINIGLMVSALLAALGIGYIATIRITGPLARLAKTAEQIASGNLQLMAETEQLDEIGALSHAFNSMTTQQRSLVTSLEQRVADRTRDLERRSKQLQIAAEVAREATAVHDLNELLRRGVNLIHDRFGYYHVAIFLVDDLGEYAVLMAATGEAGQTMLARGHRLKMGEIGAVTNQPMVGYVAQSGRPRISLDVRADPVYYPNPLLPETKSEAALPLKVGAKVIGVVDVQSIETGSFDGDTTSVLQIVTDQLAIAIQNTRLIKDMAKSVEELERMYGAYTQASWKTYQQRVLAVKSSAQGLGYRYRRLEVEPVVGEMPLVKEAIQMGHPVFQYAEIGNETRVDEMLAVKITATIKTTNEATNTALAVPIKVRGQTIGAIQVQLSGQPLTPEIVSVYEEIASRLALILENARLLQDAQSLARREQQINVLSSQIRNSISLDTILQNTVRELGKAFGTARAFIQLGVGPKAEEGTDGEEHRVGEEHRAGEKDGI